jgi:hypothetical protein
MNVMTYAIRCERAGDDAVYYGEPWDLNEALGIGRRPRPGEPRPKPDPRSTRFGWSRRADAYEYDTRAEAEADLARVKAAMDRSSTRLRHRPMSLSVETI